MMAYQIMALADEDDLVFFNLVNGLSKGRFSTPGNVKQTKILPFFSGTGASKRNREEDDRYKNLCEKPHRLSPCKFFLVLQREPSPRLQTRGESWTGHMPLTTFCPFLKAR